MIESDKSQSRFFHVRNSVMNMDQWTISCILVIPDFEHDRMHLQKEWAMIANVFVAGTFVPCLAHFIYSHFSWANFIHNTIYSARSSFQHPFVVAILTIHLSVEYDMFVDIKKCWYVLVTIDSTKKKLYGVVFSFSFLLALSGNKDKSRMKQGVTARGR